MSLPTNWNGCSAPIHRSGHGAKAFRHTCRLPHGRYQDIIQYYSIQNHFPDVYGINAFGVPSSETPERKSDARNLKAYLLLFEQVMADFLTTLHHLPDLLSLDTRMDPGAWYRLLREDVIPNGRRLYLNDTGR